jgi:hypothetical protein
MARHEHVGMPFEAFATTSEDETAPTKMLALPRGHAPSLQQGGLVLGARPASHLDSSGAVGQ